ncbi:MAG: hypothetical protein RL391_738 [Actinomycetota bacterium]|jgi:hypothetical protein
MAQKKTTPTTETPSTPSAKSPAALIAKVSAVLNPEFARQAILGNLDKGNKATLARLEKVSEVVSRVVPATPELPKFPRVEAAIKSNVEFAKKVARQQVEFAGQAVRTLAKTSAK